MGRGILQKIGAVALILFLVFCGSGIMPVVCATESEPQSEPQTQSQPTVTRVQVNPGNVSMARGTSYEFSATVSGNDNPDTTVTWAVGGAKSSGTRIQSSGVLTVSSEETADTLTVTAISNQNSSVQGKAQVTLTGGNHTVSVKASPSEGGTVSGGGSVGANGSCTVTATANSGYLFTGWELDGRTVSSSNTYTITNVTTDKALVANFKKSTVKVTLEVNNSKRGTVTGGGTIAYGGSMSLQAKANTDYVFQGWSENNKIISTDKSMTLTNITSDRKITAVFEVAEFDVYLSCNPKEGGSVTGVGAYDNGKDVKITAKANDGYTFESWTLDGNVVSNKEAYTIEDIDQDMTLVANFKKTEAKTYRIESTVANAGGVISPSGRNQVAEGTDVTYSIVPKEGYRILAVAVDNEQVGAVATYTFKNVKAAHTIVAAFAVQEAVTTTPSVQTTQPVQSTTPSTTNPQTVIQGTEGSGNGAGDSRPSTGTSGSANQSTTQQETDNTEDMSEGNTEERNTGEADDLDEMPIDDTRVSILQIMDMTEADAKDKISTGQDRELLRLACKHEFMQLQVNNDYERASQEESDDVFANTTIANVYDVLSASFTDSEKLAALQGKEMAMSVRIQDATGSISLEDQEAIDQAAQTTEGMQIGQYFDVGVVKTVQGNVEPVTELSTEMQVVLQIPNELRSKNRQYCIIRSHENADGSALVSIIKDIDTDPETITFKTDKFSAYAIAYVQQEQGNTKQKQILAAVIFMAALMLMCTVVYTSVNYVLHKKRR